MKKKGTKFAFISLIILLDIKMLHLFSLTKSLIWNFTMIVFFKDFICNESMKKEKFVTKFMLWPKFRQLSKSMVVRLGCPAVT